jgi:hypothetical protein
MQVLTHNVMKGRYFLSANHRGMIVTRGWGSKGTYNVE